MPSAVIGAVSDSITSHVVFTKCCMCSDPITHFDLLRSAVVKSISKSRGDYVNKIKIEISVGESTVMFKVVQFIHCMPRLVYVFFVIVFGS